MSAGKKVCWNCGEEDSHTARECTKPWTNYKYKPSDWDKKNSAGKKHWSKIPPKEGATEERVVNGVKHYWCAKCRRWNKTHKTSQHVKKGSTTEKPASASLIKPALYHVEQSRDPNWVFYHQGDRPSYSSSSNQPAPELV